ncbi:MAG: DNA translocase FtsK [Pseudomonadales bacterium]
MSTRGLPTREIGLFAMLALSVFVLLAIATYSPYDPAFSFAGARGDVANWVGQSGAWFADISFYLFGRVALLLPLVIGLLGLWLFRAESGARSSWVLGIRTLGTIAVVLGLCVLSAMHFLPVATLPAGVGGILGAWLAAAGVPVFGWIGLTLIALTAVVIGVQAASGLSWLAVFERLGLWLHARTTATVHWLDRRLDAYREHRAQRALRADRVAERREARLEGQSSLRPMPAITTARADTNQPVAVQANQSSAEVRPRLKQPIPKASQVPLFVGTDDTPALSLLDEKIVEPDKGFSKESLQAMSKLLELKLADFNISAEVVSVQPGPVVTRFELQPAPGIKVQRISALAKDLARSLAVISVRIVEIIPGKSVIGIEIPNEHREMVQLKEVLSSDAFQNSASPLTLALGSDIAGAPVVADVSKMPHLLVAGTTGSGKSVGVNAMLLSMLYKSTPEDVRLIMVDPKMLELSVYEGIPHLLAPVVTDMKEAAHALNWCVAEMERRYKLMAAMGVRNLAGFNKALEAARAIDEPLCDPLWPADADEPAPELHKLPMVVVVIDEFADMMMIVGKKVEQLIARIAQKARAAGIHLILATQRPSVDVITGLIKANIPTRMAYQVSSKVDSRTILDQGGAEQLLGHGDMLYLPPGTAVPIRVHGAFVSDDEVHRVVQDWKQRGKPEYIDDILTGAGDDEPFVTLESNSEGAEQEDALYDEAVQFVLESRRASISSVQRKLRIGYNRAARLIEAMEMAGVVSSMSSNGSREVLVPNREG